MEKPVRWVANSYETLITLSEDLQDQFGFAISEAQLDRKAPSAKPMKAKLREVMEVVAKDDGNTFRAMYTTKLEGVVYVLDVFQKNRNLASPPRR